MMDISKLEYSSSQHKFDFMIMLIFINSPTSTPIAVLFTPLRLCFPLSFILCLYFLFFSTSFITLFFLHHSFLPDQSLLPPPLSSSFITLFLPLPFSSSSFTLFFLRHFRFLSSFLIFLHHFPPTASVSSYITLFFLHHFPFHSSRPSSFPPHPLFLRPFFYSVISFFSALFVVPLFAPSFALYALIWCPFLYIHSSPLSSASVTALYL